MATSSVAATKSSRDFFKRRERSVNAAADQRNVFNLLAVDPELSKTLLRIRSIGQRTVELVGGRGVHPVTAVPGGMACRPNAEKLELMAGWGEEATGSLESVIEILKPKLEDLVQEGLPLRKLEAQITRSQFGQLAASSKPGVARIVSLTPAVVTSTVSGNVSK